MACSGGMVPHGGMNRSSERWRRGDVRMPKWLSRANQRAPDRMRLKIFVVAACMEAARKGNLMRSQPQ